MNQKIINIRNILKIIISLFIIFSMIKSCGKAYTWEDFIDFSNYVKNNGNTDQKAAASLIINKQDDIKNRVNVDNYLGFIVKKSGSYDIYFYTQAGTLTYNSSSDVRTPNAPLVLYYNSSGNYSSQGTNAQFVWQSSSSIYGLYENSNTITNWHDLMFQNKWNYINLLPLNNPTTQNLPWYIADIKIATANTGANYNLYYNGEPTGNLTANVFNVNAGTLYQVQILDTLGLVNNGTYNFKIVDTNNNILNQSPDFVLSWEDLTPTPTPPPSGPSGDTGICMCGPYLIMINDTFNNFSGELIPLIKTNNENLAQVREQIQKQTEATEKMFNEFVSGESGEKSILEKIYDKLFTVTSGEVKEVVDNIVENTKIDNLGVVSGEITILTMITGEPNDFIIQWQGAEYEGQQIIPSGEINFSATVREIPALKTTMDWTRIILGFSVVSILIMEIWFTLLKCLGVSTSIYEQQQEEIEQMNRALEYEREKYSPKVYETITQRNGRIRRTVRQTTRLR